MQFIVGGCEQNNHPFEDEKVKTTASDPVAGFLIDKIDGITLVADEDNYIIKVGKITPENLDENFTYNISVSKLNGVEIDDTGNLNVLWTANRIRQEINSCIANSSDVFVKIGETGSGDFLSPSYFEYDTVEHIIPKERIDDASCSDNKLLSSCKILELLDTKADIAHSHSFTDLSNTPDTLLASKFIKVDETGSCLIYSNFIEGQIKLSDSDTLDYLCNKVDGSIEIATNKLQLKGDCINPQNNSYYGTDDTGNLGYHQLPSFDNLQGRVIDDNEVGTEYLWTSQKINDEINQIAYKVKINEADTLPDYLCNKIDNSSIIITNNKLSIGTVEVANNALKLQNRWVDDNCIGLSYLWTSQKINEVVNEDKGKIKLYDNDQIDYLCNKIDNSLLIDNGILKVVCSPVSLNAEKLQDKTINDNCVSDSFLWTSQRIVQEVANISGKVKVTAIDTLDYFCSKVNASVVTCNNKIQLANDEDYPDKNKYYGTDSNCNKGWFDLPFYSGINSVIINSNNEVALVNDEDTPQEGSFYGYVGGNKGFFEIDYTNIGKVLVSDTDTTKDYLCNKLDDNYLEVTTDNKIKVIKADTADNSLSLQGKIVNDICCDTNSLWTACRIIQEIDNNKLCYDKSVVITNNCIELVNDEDSPTCLSYYGTDDTGNKGWHLLPAESNKVKATDTDAAGYLIDKVNKSVDIVDNKLQLKNDDDTPDPLNYYGTDSSGNKGWFPIPNYDTYKVKVTDIDVPDYLETKIKNSLQIDSNKLQLVNDNALPDPLSYYGTDNTGQKGWFTFPDFDTYKVKVTDIDTEGYLEDKFEGSLIIENNKIKLKGDSENPVALSYYGTDVAGNKGWFPIPNLDTYKVKVTDTDIPSYIEDKIKGSLVVDNNQIQLVNDQDSPTCLSYYGTDDTGNKGWFTFPDFDTYKVKTNSLDTPDYLETKIDKSITLVNNKLQLVNDEDTPTCLSYYGTDINGNKGWFTFPELDTYKVKLNATDTAPDYIENKVGSSITINNGRIEFVNDEDTPTCLSYYGTNDTGQKGWFTFPELDTYKVKVTDTDIPSYIEDKIKGSLVVDNDKIQLVNDSEAPANLSYYGTDDTGNKGWFTFPDFDTYKVKTNELDTAGYLYEKAGGSVAISDKIKLVNDEDTPEPLKYYGTNSAGTKGWFSFPDLDTYKVKMFDGDTPAFIGDRLQDSIELSSANRLHLVNDEETPNPNYYYGTDSSGNKGWFALPNSDTYKIKINSTDTTPDYIENKINGSLVIDSGKLQLEGDNISPDPLYYYGTDVAGNKGWFPFPDIVADTYKIKLNDTDGLPDYIENKIADSLVVDNNKIRLVNDNSSPSPLSYYGTDSSGNKGWFSLLNVDEIRNNGKVKVDDTDTEEYLEDKVAYSLQIDTTNKKVTLVNDQLNPGDRKYYGTNSTGDKGWFSLEGLVTGLKAVKSVEIILSDVSPCGENVIQLVNDEDDPGINKYYGTNASGERGWFDFQIPPIDWSSLVDKSIRFNSSTGKIEFVNDLTDSDLQPLLYYGTDEYSSRGYHSLSDVLDEYIGKVKADIADDTPDYLNQKIACSLTVVCHKLQLKGDDGNPPPLYYYGTDENGVKGWYSFDLDGVQSYKVKATFTDNNPSFLIDKVDKSIEVSSNKLQLVGDIADVDVSLNKVYGTGFEGTAQKGWYDISCYMYKVKLTAGDTADYLYNKISKSIVIDNGTIQLLNDEENPGNYKVYGTDENGTKGWIDVADFDTYKVKSSVSDLTPDYLANKFKNSISMDSDYKLQLINDDDNPGEKKVYSTDSSGIKGWHTIDSVLDFKVQVTNTDTADYLGNKITDSIEKTPAGNAIHLVNDCASPQCYSYYGTDETGNKGWFCFFKATGSVCVYTDTNSYAKAYSLVGDEESPGCLKYYGTDDGNNKGWHKLDELLWRVKINEGDNNIDFIGNKVGGSIGSASDSNNAWLQLINDEDDPGNLKVYSTNNECIKGWWDFSLLYSYMPEAFKVKASETDPNADYLDGKVAQSIVVCNDKLQLENDDVLPENSTDNLFVYTLNNGTSQRCWLGQSDIDTYKVKLNATDTTPDYIQTKLGGSITVIDSKIQLFNDQDTPAPLSVYGVAVNGEKGWIDLDNLLGNTDNSFKVKLNDSDSNPDFLDNKIDITGTLEDGGSLIRVIGDVAKGSLGAFKYYGTLSSSETESGSRGWNDFNDLFTILTNKNLSVCFTPATSTDTPYLSLVNDSDLTTFPTDKVGLYSYYGTDKCWRYFNFSNSFDITLSTDSDGNSVINVSLIGDTSGAENQVFTTLNSSGDKGWRYVNDLIEVANSIAITSGKLTLVNDSDTIDPNSYYGTDDTGIRGWYAFPAGSQSIELSGGFYHLVNDSDNTSLTNRTVYGYNNGSKGWYCIDCLVNYKVKVVSDSTELPDYLGNKISNSLVVNNCRIELDGDVASPDDYSLYGYQSGSKGWYKFSDWADAYYGDALYKVKLNENDTTPGYLLEKVNPDMSISTIGDLRFKGDLTDNDFEQKIQLRLDNEEYTSCKFVYIWQGDTESGSRGWNDVADIPEFYKVSIFGDDDKPNFISQLVCKSISAIREVDPNTNEQLNYLQFTNDYSDDEFNNRIGVLGQDGKYVDDTFIYVWRGNNRFWANSCEIDDIYKVKVGGESRPDFLGSKVALSLQPMSCIDNTTGETCCFITLKNDCLDLPTEKSYIYGTLQGDRGWYEACLFNFWQVKVDSADCPGYLENKIGGSIIFDDTTATAKYLCLDGDLENPGASTFYGTDTTGSKGWYSVGDFDTFKTKIDDTDDKQDFLNNKLFVAGHIKKQTFATTDTCGICFGLCNDITDVNYLGEDYTNKDIVYGIKSYGTTNCLPKWIYLDKSIELGNGIQLVGDVDEPTPNYFYGSDSSGNKGWFALPITSSNSIVNNGANNSFDFSLVNDQDTPDPLMYYGTDTDGIKGWNCFDEVGLYKIKIDENDTIDYICNKIACSIVVFEDTTNNTKDLRLYNDIPNADCSYAGRYYGTNSSGVKGWYISPTTTGSLKTTISNQFCLAGDVDDPGADHYYGTDNLNNKGWHPIDLLDKKVRTDENDCYSGYLCDKIVGAYTCADDNEYYAYSIYPVVASTTDTNNAKTCVINLKLVGDQDDFNSESELYSSGYDWNNYENIPKDVTGCCFIYGIFNNAVSGNFDTSAVKGFIILCGSLNMNKVTDESESSDGTQTHCYITGVYLHLDGDIDDPGANMVYGTDENGIKGWYASSSAGIGSIVKTDNGLCLVNDQDTPGSNMLYGTDSSGNKGWNSVGSYGFATVSSYEDSAIPYMLNDELLPSKEYYYEDSDVCISHFNSTLNSNNFNGRILNSSISFNTDCSSSNCGLLIQGSDINICISYFYKSTILNSYLSYSTSQGYLKGVNHSSLINVNAYSPYSLQACNISYVTISDSYTYDAGILDTTYSIFSALDKPNSNYYMSRLSCFSSMFSSCLGGICSSCYVDIDSSCNPVICFSSFVNISSSCGATIKNSINANIINSATLNIDCSSKSSITNSYGGYICCSSYSSVDNGYINFVCCSNNVSSNESYCSKILLSRYSSINNSCCSCIDTSCHATIFNATCSCIVSSCCAFIMKGANKVVSSSSDVFVESGDNEIICNVHSAHIAGCNMCLCNVCNSRIYGIGLHIENEENKVFYGHSHYEDMIHKGATTAVIDMEKGSITSSGNIKSDSGADYAEYFENLEKVIFPKGRFVSIVGDKIRISNSQDDVCYCILGVVSSNPVIIGNAQELKWKDIYQTDVWGNIVCEEYYTVEISSIIGSQVTDEKGNLLTLKGEYTDGLYKLSLVSDRVVDTSTSEGDTSNTDSSDIYNNDFDFNKRRLIIDKNGYFKLNGIRLKIDTNNVKEKEIKYRPILNPNYDTTKEYIPRSQRPEEWTPVALLGRVKVEYEGDLQVGDFVSSNDEGKAIKSQVKRFRVLRIIDTKHKIAEILIR